MKEIRDVCSDRGVGLQVVLLPELHELEDYPFIDEHRKVVGFLDQLGVESLDLAPRFPAPDPPHSLWVALDDAHPNVAAHEIIADLTLPFLRGEAE